MNVPDPPPEDTDDDADEDEEVCGTTTLQVPASPSVAFTWVCEVSGRRVTAAVPVLYPLLAIPEPAGFPEPNTPAASTALAAAATTTPLTGPAATAGAHAYAHS